MKLLTCDPAERSFALSATEITVTRSNELKIRLIYSGYVSNTVMNLQHQQRRLTKNKKDPERLPLRSELIAYGKEIDNLLKKFKPDIVGTERFQARVRSRSSETVSIMNGILLYKATMKKCEIYTYPASVWKNWVNRISNLEKLYLTGKIKGLEPHTIDSIMMALYLFKLIRKLDNTIFTDAKLMNAVRNAKAER